MNWFQGSIPDAIAETKKNNKLLLIYIEGADEMSRMMTNTYDDHLVSQKLISSNIIALKISNGSQPYYQFSAIYPVLVIPSSYFIGKNGIAIEIITGSLQPSEFLEKINKVLEFYEKSITNQGKPSNTLVEPSTSTATSSKEISQNEGSDVPSTSQTSTQACEAASNKAPLEDRLQRAKVLLEEKKMQEAEALKEKEKKDELERRSMGKAIQQAQKKRQDDELNEWLKNRAKEKEEEKLAREKVKAQIEQDRAERAARYQLFKQGEQAKMETSKQSQEAQEEAARIASINSTTARLQFRLPDGSSSTRSFSADATLGEARQYVLEEIRPPFSNFTFCTSFPKRHFTELNYAESLRDLQLAPSAVLLILPSQVVANVNRDTGIFSSIFWLLLSPFTKLWRMVISLFPSKSTRSSTENVSDQQVEPSGSTLNNQENPNPIGNSVRRERNFFKEGNVFRINNQSDDDENATWNGNSTQQM